MVVAPNGWVTPCLADWNESLLLGNANFLSLNEIWNNRAYRIFRHLQLFGKRKEHFLCGTCGTLRAATCPEDDIDEAREELLAKLFPESL
jgi:radical SAM protein with 4Fe4S-binding SPASM domain